jgi:dihydropyrimidine dehydrogenase (NAD+) subunit PreT
MGLSPKLPPEKLAVQMADLMPAYTRQEAVLEAARCLFCFDAPCIMGCPTGIDVPSFIRKITTDNLAGAARTILTANVLGASCARVCPTEVLCEGACVVLDREGDPVKIGRLQRYATDYATEHGLRILKAPDQRTGKNVAIIGGGPAGLGCASELAQLGHGVVIFEKKPNAGGLNTYGIAYYKMKPQVSLEEVRIVQQLGVEIRCNVEVGTDITVSQIESEFDAIFLGIGLNGGEFLGIPGEDLPGVMDALEFIEQIHTEPLQEVPVGHTVAVIGCGNTAIDAVTQAKRLGAKKAFIAYRRHELEMSAYDFEYELAKQDGAVFSFNSVPIEIVANESGWVSGVTFAKTEMNAAGFLQIVPGSEFREPVDMVLKAVGQQKQSKWLQQHFPMLQFDPRGVVKHDPVTGQTNIAHLFAGGDCANGGREVVNAVGEGKKAARGIHSFLTQQLATGPIQPSRYGVEGKPVGAGLDRAIRIRELEAAYLSEGQI